MSEKKPFQPGDVSPEAGIAGETNAHAFGAPPFRAREIVILQKTAKFWNGQNRFDRPDGTLCVTSYRLVFLVGTGMGGKKEYLSFPLELIENLALRRVLFISPAVEFEVAGEKYTFTFFFNARKVFAVINEARKQLM